MKKYESEFESEFDNIRNELKNLQEMADALILESQKALYDWDNRTLIDSDFMQELYENTKTTLEYKNLYKKITDSNNSSWYYVFSTNKYDKIAEIAGLKNNKFFRLSDEFKYPPKIAD